MARNQGWNALGIIAGGTFLFAGGIQGWQNMEQAEEIRGRDSHIGETLLHWAGDQKHVAGEFFGSHDGPPTPVDGVLFLTDLELLASAVGGLTAALSFRSLRK